MKYELKLSYDNQELLIDSIQKTYFDYGDRGKMLKRKIKLPVEKDSANWIVLKGLNNMTCKIESSDLIDGTLRCSIEEIDDQINLIPCALYCIREGEKYSFY